MLEYVSTGDWKEAFYSVIPKRKLLETEKEDTEVHAEKHTLEEQSQAVDLSV